MNRKRLEKINSVILEPHLIGYLMMNLESLHAGLIDLDEFRTYLIGAAQFVDYCGGIHSKLATNNIYRGVHALPDDKILEIARNVFGKKHSINKYE